MKIALVFVAALVACPSLLAMEPPSEERKMAEPLSEDQVYIVQAIERYRGYLMSSLGCSLRRDIASLLKTDKYEHVYNRMVQLQGLRAAVRKENWQPAVRALFQLMEPFQSDAGKEFRAVILTKTGSINNTQVEDEEHSLCTLCWENSKFVLASPCNHLLYCLQCKEIADRPAAEDDRRPSRPLPKICAICRADVKRYVELLAVYDLCATCEKNPANMLAVDCSHMALCEACHLEHNEKSCLVCQQPCKEFQEVYR